MPSGRERTPPPKPVFFLDRGLGRYDVAKALRARGQRVIPMFEVYPDGADQHIDDDVWIARASEEDWIALTKDDAIRKHHVEALSASRLRVFTLTNAHLTGAEMATRFTTNLHRILQRASKPGPYVYAVTASGLEVRWRPNDKG